MKKSFVYLATSVLALSACTSEEVLNEGVQSNAIGFENVVSKQSRAPYSGDLTKDNLDKFYVYGYYTPKNLDNHLYQVFGNALGGEEVTLNKTTGEWGYNNTRYWVPDATYYFYAYSCDDTSLLNVYGTASMDLAADEDGDVPGADDRVLKIKDYVCDSRHQHDLIYAEKEGYLAQSKSSDLTVVSNSKVGFNFHHILAKVNAIFSTDLAPEYEIEISNVKILHVMNMGTYSPKTNPVWTNVKRGKDNNEANAEVNLTVNPDNKVASSAVVDNEIMKVVTGDAVVMPYLYKTNGGGDVQLQFNIVIRRGGDDILSRTLVGTWSPEWQSGYSYTYNILISGTATDLDPIVFEEQKNMNIGGWQSTSGASINFSTTTTN